MGLLAQSSDGPCREVVFQIDLETLQAGGATCSALFETSMRGRRRLSAYSQLADFLNVLEFRMVLRRWRATRIRFHESCHGLSRSFSRPEDCSTMPERPRGPSKLQDAKRLERAGHQLRRHQRMFLASLEMLPDAPPKSLALLVTRTQTRGGIQCREDVGKTRCRLYFAIIFSESPPFLAPCFGAPFLQACKCQVQRAKQSLGRTLGTSVGQRTQSV